MTEMNNLLTKTDDIWENCYKAVLGVASVPSSISDIWTTDILLINILYNLGYMFTDVLDLVFYDPTNENPYWYYVAYRVGDFFIRFIYHDTS